MNNNELIEIIKAANSYLTRLNLLENDLKHGIAQINNSYEDTIKNLTHTFSTLKVNLLQVLQERETILLNQAYKVNILFISFIIYVMVVQNL